MASKALPTFIVLNVPKAGTNTYVYCKDDASVVAGDDSIFSPLVKMEVERATTGNNYVHLRFCYNNKYWQKAADSDAIVATSNKPEEDTTKATCTLFEPSLGADLYFTHVQTGWRVMMNNSTKAFHVDKNSVGAPLDFVNWSTLVKLPEHVAFKGDLGHYLKAFFDKHNYLQFSSNDPNSVLSGHRVYHMRDGHVRIKADQWGKFWRRSPNWIWADSTDVTANNKDTLFWPVKIEGSTIALRNAGNNNFCKRLNADWMENCLNAAVSTLTVETKMEVQELVLERKINNVRYRMEDARIYGETPYLAGTATVDNIADGEASISVEMAYEDSRSSTFSRSVSITAGVTATIKAGVPGIVEESIQIMTQIETAFEWNDTTTTTKTASATGTVPVPGKSRAIVHYVGTMGTCDVPFSYTQEDKSSSDGAVTQTDQIDGVYTGVNCYNFSFVIEQIQPLP